MGRQGFLVVLAVATLAGTASGQWKLTTQSDGPFGVHQQSPYLRTLTSAREKDHEEREDLEKNALVEAAIGRVESAFLTGDADELEACLVTGKRRIYLSLESDDSEPSHYGPGQVRHIFGRLFREVETRAFSSSGEVEQLSGSAVFRADWRYIVLETDEEVTDRLEFTLEEGPNAWRVFEIRSTSR